MFSKFSRFCRYGNFVAIDEDFIYSIYTDKLFTSQETAGLIGLSYRIGLAGMIFSSDVMTNEDDFILTRAELDYLRQLFGERAKVYPRGGHLGNLEFRDNQAYMVDFFRKVSTP